jgi:hypothetical protein
VGGAFGATLTRHTRIRTTTQPQETGVPLYEILAIVFMVVFIAGLFSGYPVAWLLGGLSLGFTALAIARSTVRATTPF